MDPRLVKELLLARWMTTQPGELKAAAPLSGMLSVPAGATSTESFASQLARLLGGGSEPAPLPLPVPPDMLSLLAAWNRPGAPAANTAPEAGADESAFDALITEASSRYNVDPALIRAVIRAESSFRPDAVSTAGAKGLMQLMDETAQWLGVTDPFDPRQNIDGGTRFLSWLLRKYDGNLLSALAAYNAGPGLVDRLGLKTDAEVSARWSELPEETRAYIGKVLRYMRPY